MQVLRMLPRPPEYFHLSRQASRLIAHKRQVYVSIQIHEGNVLVLLNNPESRVHSVLSLLSWGWFGKQWSSNNEWS